MGTRRSRDSISRSLPRTQASTEVVLGAGTVLSVRARGEEDELRFGAASTLEITEHPPEAHAPDLAQRLADTGQAKLVGADQSHSLGPYQAPPPLAPCTVATGGALMRLTIAVAHPGGQARKCPAIPVERSGHSPAS